MVEVRVDGKAVALFPEPEAALSCVRALLLGNPNVEPEAIYIETGRPVAPAASVRWREDLANRLGY